MSTVYSFLTVSVFRAVEVRWSQFNPFSHIPTRLVSGKTIGIDLVLLLSSPFSSAQVSVSLLSVVKCTRINRVNRMREKDLSKDYHSSEDVESEDRIDSYIPSRTESCRQS